MIPPSSASTRRRIVQISFVVKDVYDYARAFLGLYGIGPWFVFEHCPMSDFKYRGQPTVMDFTLAVAYSGTLMIELVQQNDDVPSAYNDVVAARGYGFHHFAIQSHD